MMSRFFAILVCLGVFSSPIKAAEKVTPKTKAKSASQRTRGQEAPKPFQIDPNNINVLPLINAEAVVVCDAVTGRVLYEKNADDLRSVASTQKLLTALVVAEAGDLSTNVRCTAADAQCEPTKIGLKDGEVYQRYKLLEVLLVKSMNDVARCLARDNAGSIPAFADKMNAKAREIGMKNSYFVNPNGLTEGVQRSSARDMARLALNAYRNRVLRGIMNQRTLTWKYASGKSTVFENTNKLMKFYGLCNGMKTGYTEAAGHCLVSSASQGGRHVVSVVLGERKRDYLWTDSFRLLTWGLHQVEHQPPTVQN